MDIKQRHKPNNLIKKLEKKAREFDFYQVLRLLEKHTATQIRLKAHISFGFPATDILNGHVVEDDKLQLELGFLGLLGVDSPLPQYFSEYALKDSEQANILQEFIGIFNQRFYQLYYQAWKKFQAQVLIEQSQNNFIQYLKSISGNTLSPNISKEYQYTGMLGQRIHSAQGLVGILSSYLKANIKIQQFVPQWVQLSSACQINNSNRLVLGDNIFLGDKVLDVSSKITIVAGPINLAKAMQLLPGKSAGKQLAILIQNYLPATIHFNMKFIINPGNDSCFCLGQDKIPLGFASWLGHITDKQYYLSFPGKNYELISEW